LVRLLALGLPALAGSTDFFPKGVLPTLERQAREFGATAGDGAGREAA
jgi:hypothetical protein